MRGFLITVFASACILAQAGFCMAGFPELELIYPPGSRFECSEKRIPIIGRVNCRDCTLTINDNNIAINGSGEFQVSMELEAGGNAAVIHLQDSQGNIIQKTLEIEVAAETSGPDAPGTLPGLAPDNEPGPYTTDTISSAEIAAVDSVQPVKIVNRKKLKKKKYIKKPKLPTIVEIFYQGESIAFLNVGDYLERNDRIFIPVDSFLWKKINFVHDSQLLTLTFNYNAALPDLTISVDDEAKLTPTVFLKRGKRFVPLRAVAEKAGLQVDWETNKVHIGGALFRRAAAVLNNGKEHIKTRMNGMVFTDTLFVKSDEFSLLKLNIKKETDNSIRVWNDDGKSVNISLTGQRIVVKTHGSDVRVEIDVGDMEKEFFQQGYNIPVRAVMTYFDYLVEWDSADNIAKLFPTGILVGKNVK